MRILVKVLVLTVVTAALLVTGFALGYPIGKHRGFETGTEWAMLQAKLVAREAGVIMPVYFEDDAFHVVLRPDPADCGRTDEQAGQHDDANNATAVQVSLAETVAADAPGPALPDPGQGGGQPAPGTGPSEPVDFMP